MPTVVRRTQPTAGNSAASRAPKDTARRLQQLPQNTARDSSDDEGANGSAKPAAAATRRSQQAFKRSTPPSHDRAHALVEADRNPRSRQHGASPPLPLVAAMLQRGLHMPVVRTTTPENELIGRIVDHAWHAILKKYEGFATAAAPLPRRFSDTPRVFRDIPANLAKIVAYTFYRSSSLDPLCFLMPLVWLERVAKNWAAATADAFGGSSDAENDAPAAAVAKRCARTPAPWTPSLFEPVVDGVRLTPDYHAPVSARPDPGFMPRYYVVMMTTAQNIYTDFAFGSQFVLDHILPKEMVRPQPSTPASASWLPVERAYVVMQQQAIASGLGYDFGVGSDDVARVLVEYCPLVDATHMLQLVCA